MTKLSVVLFALAAFAAGPGMAQTPAAAPGARIATLEGVTVQGKRCALAQAGCSCRETDVACIRAVADDMRLYFPKQYLAMASRCLREDTTDARYKVAMSNDAEGQRASPGYAINLYENPSHKAFCDKAYADAKGVAASLKTQAR